MKKKMKSRNILSGIDLQLFGGPGENDEPETPVTKELNDEQMQAIISKAAQAGADKATEKMQEIADETAGNKLTEFGMTKDKKQTIAKFMTNPIPSANERSVLNESFKNSGMEKGHAFARWVKLSWQFENKNPNRIPREDFISQTAEKHYKKDKSFVKMAKFYSKNKDFQNVTNNDDGGYLVQEMYGELIELLREKVFLYQVGARVTPMPNGNLNMPVHTAGSTSEFIGEGKPAIPSKAKFGNVKMISKKQVSMVIISEELMMNNSYAADQRLLDDMIREMSVVMNYTALYGLGTTYTPKGLNKYTGIPKTTISALPDGDTAADMKGDIVASNVAGSKLAYVMSGSLWAPFYKVKDGSGNYINRDEMNQGMLTGSPFHLFNAIPVDATVNKASDVFFGDWEEFEIGEQMLFEVDSSREATIETAGGEKMNLFSQGLIAFKVTSFYDFAVRHQEGFTIYKDVWSKPTPA